MDPASSSLGAQHRLSMGAMQGPSEYAKGRRLIATSKLQPGQLLLQENAYAAVIHDDVLARRCDCCCQPGEGPLLRCSGCKKAYYTNKAHQARGWRSGHKDECAGLRQLAPRVPPPTVRLAARAVLRHYRETCQAAQETDLEQSAASPGSAPSRGSTPAGGADSSTGDRYEAVLSLLHHWESVPDPLKIQYAQMGALAWQLVHLACPAAAEKATPRDLAMLVARFACNNHTICDEELRPLGVGIYPLVSMANHSCSPNCMQSFQGSTLVLRAITQVAPGQELTIAYVELGATRWERRASLGAQYYFDIDTPDASSPAAPGSVSMGDAAQQTAPAGEEGTAVEVPASPSRRYQHSSLPDASAGGTGNNGLPPGASNHERVHLRVVPLAGGAAELRLYSCGRPPWRHDERDVELTAVGWLGGMHPRQPSVGGMWGELLPHESTMSPTTAAGAALESFPVDMDGLALVEPLTPGMRNRGGAGSAVTGLGSAQDGQQAGKQRIIVHFWSPGVQHAPASQHSEGEESLALARQETSATQQHQQQQQQQQQGDQLQQRRRQQQQRGQQQQHVQQQQQEEEQQEEDAAFAGLLQAAVALAECYAQALRTLAEAESLLCPAAAGAVAEAAAASGAAGATAMVAALVEQSLAAVSPAATGGGRGDNRTSPSIPMLPGGVQEHSAPRHGLALELGPRHVLRMRLLSTAMRAAIAGGDRWERAADWARQLLPIYQFVYPEVWPNLGLHYATLAKLEHLLGGRPEQAQHAAQRALAILSVTQGAPSGGAGGVVEEVQRVLFESSQELAQLGN